MKTPSGTIALVTLATLVAAVVACTNGTWVRQPPPDVNLDNPPMPPVSNEKFVKQIVHRRTLKDGSPHGEEVFRNLLNNGHYSASKGNRIHFIYTDDKRIPPRYPKHREWMPAQGNAGSAAQLEIKTDKVIVSETAQGLPTENLTLISPHVTQQIAVNTPEDVTAVLNLLAK
jgi:hypothetical protein